MAKPSKLETATTNPPAEQKPSAREAYLKELSINPMWKEVPPDECVVGIGGAKPSRA
jgi:hypothetical protein